MPTPIGHALGAFAVGWLLAGPPPTDAAVCDRGAGAPAQTSGSGQCRVTFPARFWRWVKSRTVRRGAAFAAVGLLPDLDLLVGMHSGLTHSVGAAVVLALGVAMVARRQRLAMLLGAMAAYLSHVVLDWLGQDSSVPLGVMALWPFSERYFHSGLDWFLATDRRYWLAGFWSRNLRTLCWEVLVLVPLAWAAWWFRQRVWRAHAAPRGPAGH